MPLVNVDTVAAVDEAAKVLLPQAMSEVEKLVTAMESIFDGYEITISIKKKGANGIIPQETSSH